MRLVGLLAASLALSGCVTAYQNNPSPTATEELLVNHSAERAAAGLNLRLPRGTRAVLDTTGVSTLQGSPFLIAAVRAHLIARGIDLVDRPRADVIVELRVAANGIDDLDRVLGFPATTIPSVQPGIPALAIPEVAIFSEHQRRAVTEFWAIAEDVRTGKLIAAQGPVYAVSRIVNRHLLAGLVRGDELAPPEIVSRRP